MGLSTSTDRYVTTFAKVFSNYPEDFGDSVGHSVTAYTIGKGNFRFLYLTSKILDFQTSEARKVLHALKVVTYFYLPKVTTFSLIEVFMDILSFILGLFLCVGHPQHSQVASPTVSGPVTFVQQRKF